MALQNGFIALHRSLLSWGWHSDPATLSVFIHLLLLANYEPKEWKGVQIERGQLVTGRKALADQTGLSEQSIRTALNHLKSTGEITIESTNKYSLITIVNYRKFQGITEESTSKATNSQPATNQQLTSNQPQRNKYNKETKEQVVESVTRKARFTPPTVEEVAAYCRERRNSVDAQRFVDHYATNGWRRGNTPIKDWRACVRTWERSQSSYQSASPAPRNGLHAIPTAEEYAAGVDPSGFGWG